MVRVLFVCLGNICRSPTAEGVFRSLVDEAGLADAVEGRSAGTHAYHAGEGADARSSRAALRRGYDLSAHRARPVRAGDFDEFDYVLAMDDENLGHLESFAEKARADGAKARRARLKRFLEFAPTARFTEVPDPYARGEEGFELVLDLVESACAGLIDHIRRTDLGAGRETGPGHGPAPSKGPAVPGPTSGA